LQKKSSSLHFVEVANFSNVKPFYLDPVTGLKRRKKGDGKGGEKKSGGRGNREGW